ncbi:hypothetical protein EDD21DRAFT_411529 [Dissophora ornata]|nr:hypothetical protein BGZ58_001491 [Dissophora ornata]KAI8605020.1 hypothetical protein EDD21DRAFT_411529 [Dissophora ornata]
MPLVTTGASSAYVEDQGLYILGGSPIADSGFATPQAVMMDLSVSWNASQPVFKALPNGPNTWSMPSSVTADGKNWFTMTNGTGYVYNFQSAAWSTALPQSENLNSARGLSGVTDPDTGIIYVPNGYIDTNNNTSLLKVDLAAKTFDSAPMYGHLNSSHLFSSAWSSHLKSIVFFVESETDIYTYNTTEGWELMTPTGDVPSTRIDSCLVSAFGGTKMVLFGGYSGTQNTSLNDIYILDVAAMSWKRGPDVDISNRRDSSSCAFSNGQFIAWGGVNTGAEQDIMASNSALVFSLNTTSWTSSYIASSSSPTAAPSSSPAANPSSSSVDSSSSKKTQVAVIVGPVLGAFVVAFAIGVVIICRARAQRIKAANEYNERFAYPSNLSASSISGSGRSKESLVA